MALRMQAHQCFKEANFAGKAVLVVPEPKILWRKWRARLQVP
jgi:hypothetical protein